MTLTSNNDTTCDSLTVNRDVTETYDTSFIVGTVEAGEDPEMVKEEFDFRGRDFEKQYACRFKTGVVVWRGTFGKVTVERSVSGGLEPIFEFNLHKVSYTVKYLIFCDYF